MKLSHMMAAAGIAIASLGVATSADARPGDHDRGRHEWHHDNGNHYGNRWGRGHDRGWHRGYHNRCHTEWRHHHRVQICR